MAPDEDDILLDSVLQELELLTPGVKVGPHAPPFISPLLLLSPPPLLTPPLLSPALLSIPYSLI